jgi:hypothetical protein
MTDPTAPRPLRDSGLPPNSPGGVFEGHLEALTPDFYDERHTDPARVAEMADWGPFEDLTAADPPGQTGFDLASAGPAPSRTETLSGAVRRVSSTGTGLLLEELPDDWLNVSRSAKGIDLGAFGPGDVVVCEVEVGSNGRRYLTSIRHLETFAGDAG